MKLLFDQNLAPHLAQSLADLFPESSHASELGLDQSLDQAVINRARQDGFCIVTKDSDFNDLISLQGYPPKVLWIRRGNCSTDTILEILRQRHALIESFGDDGESGVLTLY